jgi:hypothetical protein
MDGIAAKRIETLLQIIADELYIARTDREYEGESTETIPGEGPTEPEMWARGGRQSMIVSIESRRNDLESQS